MSRIVLPNQLPLYADSFVGTSTYIEVDAPGTEHYSSQPLTLLAYVKKFSAGGGNAGVIYARTDGTTNYLVLGVDINSAAGYRFNATSGTANAPVVASERMFGTASGDWHHIGAVWDGSVSASSMRLYGSVNNGILQDVSNTSSTGTGSVEDNSSASVRIGSLGASRPFTGEIAYVARWNRVLDYTELVLAQRFGPSAVPNGLVFFYRDGVDASPTKNTLTKTNVRSVIAKNVWSGVNTREVFYSLGSPSVHEITGTITEDKDTVSGTVSNILSVSGTVTESSDSFSGVVSSVWDLSGTITEATDTSSGNVKSLWDLTGTVTEGSDTADGVVVTLDGTVYLSGNITEGSDTSSGSITNLVRITGTVTETPDSLGGVLRTFHAISGTVTETQDSSSGTVSVLSVIEVSGTVTEDPDRVSGELLDPDAVVQTKGGKGKASNKKKRKKILQDTTFDELVSQLQEDSLVSASHFTAVKEILDKGTVELTTKSLKQVEELTETLVEEYEDSLNTWALERMKLLVQYIVLLEDKLQDAEDVILLLSAD